MKLTTKIRVGLYETNSSSMHSLSFSNKAPTVEVDEGNTEHLVLGVGEYGWGYETLTNPLEKMDYLAIEVDPDEDEDCRKRTMLVDAIKRVYPNVTIRFEDSGYIDHQSYGEVWDDLSTTDEVYKMIFNNSYIEIDNDNH